MKRFDCCNCVARQAWGGLEMYFANISNDLASHFAVTQVVSSRLQVAHKVHGLMKTMDKKVHYFPLVTACSLARVIDQQRI